VRSGAAGIRSENTNGNEEVWEFGGLSADGRVAEDIGPGDEMSTASRFNAGTGGGGGGVSCCKHLLACVLAERWNDVLGGYVDERLVGREEGAGLIGEL
jgi:hypothetical protein